MVESAPQCVTSSNLRDGIRSSCYFPKLKISAYDSTAALIRMQQQHLHLQPHINSEVLTQSSG